MSPVTLAFERHFALLVTVTNENYFITNQVVIRVFTTLLLSIRLIVR
jgi:hypothetical protein